MEGIPTGNTTVQKRVKQQEKVNKLADEAVSQAVYNTPIL
jgi:hypothetical protein